MRLLARVLLSLVLLSSGVLLGIAITRSGSPSDPASGPAAHATSSDEPASESAFATAPPGSSATTDPGAAVTVPAAAPTIPPVSVGPDFTRIASQAVKAVVNISSVSIVRAPSDPFFRLFGGEDPFMRERRSQSLGSGVIVSGDGYIVTNGHVLGQGRARQVTVTLSDKRELPGQVVGIDPATDIALLKVEAGNVTVLPWGDSNRLLIGEWVLAIGSPFSLSQTVTAGIVSATGRANLGFSAYEDFIQTDAAINPGNSGGALVSARGDLVGINTGIFSQSGGYQGVGFAVPSVLAQRIINDLAEYGEVRRGHITGVWIDALSPQNAQKLGYGETGGVLIVQMNTTSAIYQAGARPGHIITGFNGTRVTDPSQLFRLVADAPIGSTARVDLFGEGRTIQIDVPIVSASQNQRRQ